MTKLKTNKKFIKDQGKKIKNQKSNNINQNIKNKE
jgi:hypothetical protein